jgi:DNA-binding NtrC family response regulator
MIEKTLAEAGYIVVGPVATIRDALILIEREAIDCAILDIELADGKAGPVAEALVRRGIRFILATGYDPSTIDLQYRKAPVVEKAFDLNELMDAVEGLR